MFATSLTTMVAFFVSGISPLLMVQSFGLFTGFLVLTNYISVITFFPSVIIVYHLKIKTCLRRVCECRCCRGNVYNIQDDSNTKSHDSDSYGHDKIKRDCDNNTDCHDNSQVCHDNIKRDLDINNCDNSIGACNLQERNYDNHDKMSTKQSSANGGVVNPGFERDVISTHDISVSVQKPEIATDTATDDTQERARANCNETTVIGENVLGKSLNGHIPKGVETSNEKCQDYHQLCGCRWKRQKHFLIRFFEGPFYWLISHRVLRWFILVGFAVMVATFSYFCTKIVPDEEEIQAYNPQSNYGKSTRMRLYSFKLTERDQMLRMYIIWGLKKQNVSSCDYRNIQNVTNCRGQTTFDEDFDINKPGGQLAMARLCERLYDLPPERLRELKIKMDDTTSSGIPMINCFMHDIKRYFEHVSKTLVSSPTTVTPVFPAPTLNFSIPFDKEQMIEVMKLHPAIYQPSRLPDNFTNWFEIALGYWMTNRMTLKITDDYKVYDPILGEKKTPDTQRTQGIDIFYGTKMNFAAVVISTSINARALGYTTGLPLFEKWEQLVSELRADLPEGVNHCFLATPEINIYHWLRVQQSLSYQAIMGLGLGIALAFPVLVFGTQNIIVGVLATLSISLSTICVVGIISVAGWELGVLESVNLCLVVGLSIDYEVHLAEGYYYSTKTCRRKRVKQLLGEVGISVLSGAMTTLGAATFMLFAELQFYLQFGVFMFCTIGFSILFGLAFFTTTLALLGPQNDCGSLSPIWKKMKSCCSVTCKKKEN